MYKKSPKEFRDNEEFYPLQLQYILKERMPKIENEFVLQKSIFFATAEDIPAWMDLVKLVVDGFPYLNADQYLELLKRYITEKHALVMKQDGIAVGAMTFSQHTGSIDFFGLHPQYRKQGIAKAFLARVMDELLQDTDLSVTTFREGDKADLGYRSLYQGLGFAEAELLTEFGYPTQKFVLKRDDTEESDHE